MGGPGPLDARQQRVDEDLRVGNAVDREVCIGRQDGEHARENRLRELAGDDRNTGRLGGVTVRGGAQLERVPSVRGLPVDAGGGEGQAQFCASARDVQVIHPVGKRLEQIEAVGSALPRSDGRGTHAPAVVAHDHAQLPGRGAELDLHRPLPAGIGVQGDVVARLRNRGDQVAQLDPVELQGLRKPRQHLPDEQDVSWTARQI